MTQMLVNFCAASEIVSLKTARLNALGGSHTIQPSHYHITITFHRICGIKTKDEWPLPSEGEWRNPDTDEIYDKPDCASDMQDLTNIKIFRKAADIIWNEMQVSAFHGKFKAFCSTHHKNRRRKIIGQDASNWRPSTGINQLSLSSWKRHSVYSSQNWKPKQILNVG